MMERPIESRALAVMRVGRGWKPGRLAAGLGIEPETLYDYERGKLKPSRSFLERAAAVLGYPAHHVDRTLAFLAKGDGDIGRAGGGSDWELEQIASDLASEGEGLLLSGFKRVQRLAQAVAEREAARIHWPRLRPYPPEVRAALVRETPEFRTWAVAEAASHEASEAALEDADEAVELAELACEIARQIPEPDPRRLRAQGYARFHLGNAIRVKGSLQLADAAFEQAQELWDQGAAGDPDGLFDEARVLGMQASLRREQRRLPEAVRLLDEALAVDRGNLRIHLLLNRAKTMEEMNDFEEAIATLRRAEPLIDAEREPRLLWNLRFNLAENLIEVGRHEEARPLLDQVREQAVRYGKGLTLLRLVWLGARVALGQRRFREAERGLEQVRKEFLAREIDYDAGLASLELAVVHMEQGNTGRVADLTRELAPVFVRQGVSREALATLTLFRQAVETESLTVELARQFMNDFRRLRAAPPEARAENTSPRPRRKPGGES